MAVNVANLTGRMRYVLFLHETDMWHIQTWFYIFYTSQNICMHIECVREVVIFVFELYRKFIHHYFVQYASVDSVSNLRNMVFHGVPYVCKPVEYAFIVIQLM